MAYTLTRQEYSKAKAALTRARNSGDDGKLLDTVKAARHLFDRKGYPDNWSRWRNALEDLLWGDRDCREDALAERDEWQ